jgi:hypothetical protein
MVDIQSTHNYGARSRNAQAIWDSRCEDGHGDQVRFANKHLWNLEGQFAGTASY